MQKDVSLDPPDNRLLLLSVGGRTNEVKLRFEGDVCSPAA